MTGHATSPDGLHAHSSTRGSLHPGWRLRADLRVCRIGTRFVFLDLLKSRYFLLEGLAAGRFASFCDGQANEEDTDWLKEKHIVEPGQPVTHRPLPSSPTGSIFDTALPRARPLLIAEALREQTVAYRLVRREPIAALLTAPTASSFDLESCRAVAAACRAAARYRSAADQCLPNAYAMRQMLGRRGIAANIIIGVMLPFAAHCWLQAGDIVLSDPFGGIQNFHPLVAA